MDYSSGNVRGHENSNLITSELVFKIPIKVYMCVLNNNRLMAAIRK